MRILVTGANGQLAKSIRQMMNHFSQAEILFMDRSELDIVNIASTTRIVTRLDAKYIINCAAYTNVEKAETDIENCILVNHQGVKNLALACENLPTRIIHISTDYVFDGNSKNPYSETDPCNPINQYGLSKLRGEAELDMGKHIIIRTSWLYSVYGHNFFRRMWELANRRSEITVVDDQISSPVYCNELVKFIALCCNQDVASGLYNFSNSDACSWYDFASAIIRYVNPECIVKPISSIEFPQQAKRPSYSFLSTEKIVNNLGFQPISWKIGLEDCVNFFNE